MKVGFIPWQHQRDRSAGRRQNVPVVSKSAEDAAKQFSFLASIPSVRQSHIQQVNAWTGAQHSLGCFPIWTNRAISKLENYENATLLY
jgi:hypothetical protein